MKKIIALALAVIMSALAFAGCTGSTTGSSSNASSSSSSADKVYKIGICQQIQHEALDAATEGFKAALTEKLGKDKVQFDVQNAQGDSATCATINNNFVANKVDLILANATHALEAAHTATNTIPILGTSITEYGAALSIDDFKGTTGINVSGTSDLAPLDEQANMVKELFPNAKTVGILYCSAEVNSKYQVTKISEYLKKLGYECKEFSFSDSNDVASVTTNACAQSDVLYIPTDNTAASNTEVINNIAQPAKKPIITGEEGTCKGCGVATLSISYYDIGYTTGEMAYDVLVNGADISKMEIKYAPKATKKYNADVCKALNITPPAGYEAIAK